MPGGAAERGRASSGDRPESGHSVRNPHSAMDVRLVEIQLAEAGSPGLPAHGRFVDLGPGEAAAVDALAPGVVASAWGRWRATRAAGGAIGLEFRSRDRGWVPLGLRDGRLDLDRPSDFLVEGEDLWMATEAGVLRTPERDGDLRRADLYATLAGPADLMRPPAGAGVWARVRSDPARASRLTHGAARPAPVAGDPFVQRLAVASGAWRFWLRESRAMGSGGRLHLVAENLHCEWIDPDNGPLPCDPEGGRFPFDDVTDLRGAHGGLLVASRAGVAAWAPGTRLAWADAAVWPIPGGASALQPVKGPIAPEILAVGPDGDGRATLWRMSTEPSGARFRPLGPWRCSGSSITLAHDPGDLNGDGQVDLVLGNNAYGVGGTVWVVEGPITGDVLVADAYHASLSGGATGDAFGSWISLGGDLDGDGYDDLVISALGADPGGRISAGSAYVFYGGGY